MFRRLAILLAFVSAFAACRVVYDPNMTSRLGATEYYRWDIKSLEGSGFGYLRIPCTDHLWPDSGDIDTFIDFIKGIDTDSVWMHFHSDRQSALGASSMRVKYRDPARPDEKADNNERVSRLLYQYVQENRADGYKVSWTDWLSANMLLRFSPLDDFVVTDSNRVGVSASERER